MWTIRLAEKLSRQVENYKTAGRNQGKIEANVTRQNLVASQMTKTKNNN